METIIQLRLNVKKKQTAFAVFLYPYHLNHVLQVK